MSNSISVSLNFSEETVKLVIDAMASVRDERSKSKERFALEMVEKLGAYLPVILSKFGDKTSEVDPVLLKSFLQTFTSEQMEAITPHLRTEQFAILGELLNSFSDFGPASESNEEKSPSN